MMRQRDTIVTGTIERQYTQNIKYIFEPNSEAGQFTNAVYTFSNNAFRFVLLRGRQWRHL